MTRREKLEERIRANPTPNDVAFEEFDAFLRQNGFLPRTSKGRNGSHFAYVHLEGGIRKVLTVTKPHGGPNCIKRAYLRLALELIDRIRRERAE